jgi:branched-chain amino acid transport system substrate-binding protein
MLARMRKRADSGGTVKIGVFTDMTGVFSDLAGAGAVTAAQMAIDDFVESERPLFKIAPVSADHQNKPDIAAKIVAACAVHPIATRFYVMAHV